MTDKVRLAEITKNMKQQATFTGSRLLHQVILSQEDYIYLYRQAEKVQELEKQNQRYDEEVKQGETEQLFIKNGRKPWELREGDVLKDSCGGVYVVKETVGEGVVTEKHFLLSWETVKNKHKVVCFAENRIDKKMEGEV